MQGNDQVEIEAHGGESVLGWWWWWRGERTKSNGEMALGQKGSQRANAQGSAVVT